MVTSAVTSAAAPNEPVGSLDELRPFTDDELTALALAADPDQIVDDDAVPFGVVHGEFGDLLPSWYMPAPIVAHTSRRRNAIVAAVVISSLLLINALGLCVTYGRLEIPF